jgi:hypothetical protein
MSQKAGAGGDPLPPAPGCIALLPYDYVMVSDAQVIELTLVDARWWIVLDVPGRAS